MILILSLIILYMFYYFNGFKCLIRAARRAIPETETLKEPETGPPVIIAPAPAPIQAPPQYIQPAPVDIPTRPAPAAALINRQQLERAARDCLTLSGCKFDTYNYCRMKSDIELMDIIKDYNLNR
jgi:hypothetical protein